jgi:hypothetical protein
MIDPTPARDTSNAVYPKKQEASSLLSPNALAKKKELGMRLWGFTLASVVIVSHLQPSATEPALDIETLVGFTAVEDALVTTDFFGNKVEWLDEAKTEFLALLILGDGNVFNVSNVTETVDATQGGGYVSAGFWNTRRRGAYNFFSTISAPVPTTGDSVRLVSSMTMM